MFKRIYIDNFKCLVNFELKVDLLNLFLGPNGVGKSTLFEVLQKLQAFIKGNSKVEQIFSGQDLTRWQTSLIQSFEIEIEGNGGVYKYELAIEYNEVKQKARVNQERLWFNDQPLLKFELGEAQLYQNDYSLGPAYSFDWSQSLLAAIPERGDNRDNADLIWFRKRIARFIIVQINPMMMDTESSQEDKLLEAKAQNFTAWYRHISQNQGKVIQLTQALSERLDGFSHFNFEAFGEQHKSLRVHFIGENDKRNPIQYRFNELSDGQRVLIVLYTLIYYTQGEDYTLCIDEPENFVALAEIQPWLTLLYDLCDEGDLQALLISHHPELIDYLATSAGYWFDRQSNRPVRVKRVSAEGDVEGELPVSELVARGWLYE